MKIEDLLASERSRAGFSSADRDAIWNGVERSIGALPPSPNADPAANHDAPSEAGPSPTGSAAPSTAAKSVPTALGTKTGVLMALAALVGGVAGAGLHARLSTPRVVVIEHAAPAPTGSLATSPAPSSAASPETPLPKAPPSASAAPAPRAFSKVAAPPSTSSTAPPKDLALARERTLLDMARTALARGDATAALTAVDTHAREFPKSQLAEEREVLAIQALVGANRQPEARRRAAMFRTNFPNSPLLSIVEETVQ